MFTQKVSFKNEYSSIEVKIYKFQCSFLGGRKEKEWNRIWNLSVSRVIVTP